MVLGLIVSSALIFSLQLPFLHERAVIRISTQSLASSTSVAPPLAWPTAGSAAVDIPALGVAQGYHNTVAPIASLTKMMTAYVTLKKFPLAIGQTGPCITVTNNDVLAFERDKTVGDSAVIVEEGEQLCEFGLLNGMLVHSAANYAGILSAMVSPTQADFIALMNESAARLGLHHTHYNDIAGISDDSVSTALDQARLASRLMQSPLVRSIVDQTTVDLPVAGYENSFTPLVGSNNVVGVKSGRTDAAGGCDVMALAFRQDGRERIVYAVVLGQRGGDLLGPAGTAAFALAQSALADRFVHIFRRNTVFGHVGFGRDTTTIALARTSHRYVWGQPSSPYVSWRLRRITVKVQRGEVVGWLIVHGFKRPLALVAQGTVVQPTLWHRIL